LIVVLDASTLVGAALKPDSMPEQTLLRIVRDHQLIVSDEVAAEYRAVLERPKFARSVPTERRDRILALVDVAATFARATEAVGDCRDPKDNMYLALAAAHSLLPVARRF
jgi:uncharacterized protein